MAHKKKKRKKLSQVEEQVKAVHRMAGRVDLPSNKAFKDQSKYDRKKKHKKSYQDDWYSSFFFAPYCHN